MNRRVGLNLASQVKLATTLAELQSAQLQLVELKLVGLGQLVVAGIAHENNPAAAIIRSVDHLAGGLEHIIDANHRARAAFDRGFRLEPLSTREIRKQSKALADRVPDNALARRLVEMGVSPGAAMDGLVREFGGLEQAASYLGVHFNTGKFLRNISTCGQRIEALVRGLKNYARPESDKPGRV